MRRNLQPSMTCLFHPRFASRASATTSRLVHQQWRPLSTQLKRDQTSKAKSTPSSTTTEAQTNDPEREKLWQEIHSLESFLGLPQTKATERWREKRLRGRATTLFEQKLQKTLPESEEPPDASTDAIPITPLVQKLYESFKEELQTAGQPTADRTEESTPTPTPPAAKSETKAATGKVRKKAKKESTLPSEKASTAEGTKRPPRSKKDMEAWQIQKEALEKKFKDEKWAPKKRLSPDTIDGIRMLHKSDPEAYPTAILSKQFEVSPEAIRRILKSKWTPGEEEAEDRRLRWERRGERIWTSKVQMGVRPPKKWRQTGVGRVGPGETPRWKKRRTNKPEAIPWGDSAPEVEDQGVDQGSISDQIL